MTRTDISTEQVFTLIQDLHSTFEVFDDAGLDARSDFSDMALLLVRTSTPARAYEDIVNLWTETWERLTAESTFFRDDSADFAQNVYEYVTQNGWAEGRTFPTR